MAMQLCGQVTAGSLMGLIIRVNGLTTRSTASCLEQVRDLLVPRFFAMCLVRVLESVWCKLDLRKEEGRGSRSVYIYEISKG